MMTVLLFLWLNSAFKSRLKAFKGETKAEFCNDNSFSVLHGLRFNQENMKKHIRTGFTLHSTNYSPR